MMRKTEGKRTPELAEIKKSIIAVLSENGFRDAKIILFGSRARGDYRAHSDWDFLIILKNELKRDEKWNLAEKIHEAIVDNFFVPCDVLVKSETEVEKRKNIIGSVIRSAVKNGVEL